MPSHRALRLVLLSLLALCAAAAAPAHHILYRVRGPHGATVYLLGSVHLLTADAGKLPAVVDSAFARASTVVFEADLDSMMTRASELAERAKEPEGKTLRTALSPAGAARLDTVLHAYGLTVDQLGAFKPWFVSMVMSQLVMQRMGFQAEYGIDTQLDTRARAAHKRIVGLESVDFQFGLFDSLSPADQERLVLEAGAPDSAGAELQRIKEAWLAGDAGQLDRIVNRNATTASSLYETLLYQRNQRWVPQIEAMLKGRDDVLVVVGAAHLVGPRGVVALLRARGFTVEQL